jgi:hypothetical protein
MHLFSLLLDSGRPPIQVLVAQYSSEQSIQSLFELIYTDPANSRRRASAIVLRPCVTEHFTPDDLAAATKGGRHKPGQFLDAVAEGCVRARRSFGRFEDIPVFVLHSDDFLHRLSANINPGAVVPQLVQDHLSDPATIDAIRACELIHLVARSHALLIPVEGAYYDPPSHRPIRSFLRIGNIQYSRHAVDALAFWLLPYVAKARGILIDTWSISSIGFNLSRVLTLYDGRAPIPVEMLSRYQDRSREAQAALLGTLDRLWSDCSAGGRRGQIPVTCIVSATQTGSLVDVLKDGIELARLPIDMSFVALFRLAKTDALPSLCDRSDDPDFAPMTPDSVEAGSAIHIDPQVYFPLSYIDMEYTLRIRQARSFALFIGRYGTEGLFSAHRDQASDGATRHHAVHLDMAELIAHPAFQAGFDTQIAALEPKPRVVLTPRHEVARALGERAVAVLAAQGHAAVHLQHPTLLLREEGPGAKDEAYIRGTLAGLGVADALLVLDDCFITGDRLTGYQTRLRQLGVRARLHYRVGVARPDNIAHWTECQMMLGYRAEADQAPYKDNSVDAIETLSLPNWQEPECPWCAEVALYNRMEKEGILLSAHVRQRLDRLADRRAGLVDDLFFVGPNDQPLELYSGSIFVPPGTPQATVFASVGSAMQQLRTIAPSKRPMLGPRRYPIATVLKAREYLKEVYKDSILRAAILRAGTAAELVYMNEPAERRRAGLVTALLTSLQADERDIAYELILAHGARKCPIDATIGDAQLEADAARLLADVRSLSSRRAENGA